MLWLGSWHPGCVTWARQFRSSRRMGRPHRTVWYELQARDWPLKNQAAEALIWQIGSGEGMKRVLASVSLGKEVTVSSHLFSEREEGLEGGGLGTRQVCPPSFTHLRNGAWRQKYARRASLLPAKTPVSFITQLFFFRKTIVLKKKKDWKEIKVMVLIEL